MGNVLHSVFDRLSQLALKLKQRDLPSILVTERIFINQEQKLHETRDPLCNISVSMYLRLHSYTNIHERFELRLKLSRIAREQLQTDLHTVISWNLA